MDWKILGEARPNHQVPRSHLIPSWDLVLAGLRRAPFELLDSVELKIPSLKTVLLVVLTFIKSFGNLQAFSVDESCLEFGPADSHVILRPRPGYVPKVHTTPFRDPALELLWNSPRASDALTSSLFWRSQMEKGVLLEKGVPSKGWPTGSWMLVDYNPIIFGLSQFPPVWARHLACGAIPLVGGYVRFIIFQYISPPWVNPRVPPAPCAIQTQQRTLL